MRSSLDRLRHALSFELLALLIVVPLGALAFGRPLQDIGVVSIISATLAMVWNFAYNHLFDLWMLRRRGSTRKSPGLRVIHAVLFEAGLLVVLLAFMAWYLSIGLLEALVMDLSFALFYLLYALVFNWGYDRLFPLPDWAAQVDT